MCGVYVCVSTWGRNGHMCVQTYEHVFMGVEGITFEIRTPIWPVWLSRLLPGSLVSISGMWGLKGFLAHLAFGVWDPNLSLCSCTAHIFPPTQPSRLTWQLWNCLLCSPCSWIYTTSFHCCFYGEPFFLSTLFMMLKLKYASELVVMAMLITPALRSQKQEGCKFEDSLSYIAHSKSVITTN